MRPRERDRGENRFASRKWVSIQARVSEPGSDAQHVCLLTDASNTGCRMYCDRLELLPDEIVLWPEGLSEPLTASVIWRKGKIAGLALKGSG